MNPDHSSLFSDVLSVRVTLRLELCVNYLHTNCLFSMFINVSQKLYSNLKIKTQSKLLVLFVS